MSKKILSYLKPNFSRHWGNWLLAPLFAFCFGFVPVSVFAEIYSGKIWNFYNIKNGYDFDRPTACSKSGGNWQETSPGNGNYACKHPTANVFGTGSLVNCAPSIPECHIAEPEPEDCPESGSYATTAAHRQDNGSTYPKTGSFGGCGVTLSDAKVECFDGVCWVQYTYTYNGGDTRDPNIEDDIEEVPETFLQQVPDEKGPEPETSVTEVHEPTTETLPDGTVVDVESETTTTTRGAGTSEEVTEEKTTFTRSDGIIKTETKTTTTTTHPDGSKTVTEDVSYSYTDTGTQQTYIDHGTGTVHTTVTPGNSASGGTTTTTNYDADGNKTGSTTTTTGSGSGVGNQGEEGGGCEENPFSTECVGEFSESDGEYAFSEDAPINAYTTAVTELNELVSDIKSEMDGMFDGLSGGGTLQPYNVVLYGQTADIGIMKWIPHFDAFNLGALVMAVAAFLAFLILMRTD